ncbi:hypothetical protein ACRW9N_10985 [Listeria aquatica]|uniref:hypothetical protein n=1 Tax=Listeria aquatica TaxID=1494960 RepID=UPI003EF894B9
MNIRCFNCKKEYVGADLPEIVKIGGYTVEVIDTHPDQSAVAGVLEKNWLAPIAGKR